MSGRRVPKKLPSMTVSDYRVKRRTNRRKPKSTGGLRVRVLSTEAFLQKAINNIVQPVASYVTIEDQLREMNREGYTTPPPKPRLVVPPPLVKKTNKYPVVPVHVADLTKLDSSLWDSLEQCLGSIGVHQEEFDLEPDFDKDYDCDEHESDVEYLIYMVVGFIGQLDVLLAASDLDLTVDEMEVDLRVAKRHLQHFKWKLEEHLKCDKCWEHVLSTRDLEYAQARVAKWTNFDADHQMKAIMDHLNDQ